MYKFNKLVKVGTWVLLDNQGWAQVTEINDTRKWIKVDGWLGSFQAGHVTRFTNTNPCK